MTLQALKDDLADLEGKLRVGGRPTTIVAGRLAALYDTCPGCGGGTEGPPPLCAICAGTMVAPSDAMRAISMFAKETYLNPYALARYLFGKEG
jgi:hypothetical protein